MSIFVISLFILILYEIEFKNEEKPLRGFLTNKATASSRMSPKSRGNLEGMEETSATLHDLQMVTS
jgi:hypothetical protein